MTPNDAGPPGGEAYRPHLITFIDILGFARLVSGESSCEVVEELLHALSEQARVYDGRDPALHVVNFSDTIVRFRPAERDLHAQLVAETKLVARMQGVLAERRVPIRGAITVGGLHHTKDRRGSFHLFGPGLVRAYRIESQAARYPRVLLDPRLRAEAGAGDSTLPLRSDMDGALFVDYLRALGAECDSGQDYVEFLKGHKAWANAGLRQARDRRRAEKYGWIGRYHNAVVCELRSDWLHGLGISPDKLVVRGRLRRK